MKTNFLLSVLCLICFMSPAQTKIDTAEIVRIGGIRQLISIKGDNKENPVLLILHGGPGKSLTAMSDGFTDKLKKEFVVVNWDQRGTPKTEELNNSSSDLSPDLLKKDALEVVSYLIEKFRQKKIFLISHSWGSVMGFDIAVKHPELLYAYIPVSPVIDADKSALLSVNSLKKWAAKTENNDAIRELESIQIPFRNKDDFFLAQKWLFVHNGVEGAGTEDFRKIYYKWMDTWFPVWKENAKTNLFSTVPEIPCPVYFFIGSGDNQSYYTIAEQYYQFVKAKNKKLFWFKKSGHTIFNTEPEKLQDLIIKKIKPKFYQDQRQN
ncbi:alpha/beta fold hydrolase [Chryseobacterium arthrosphaerae]|uniref:alpha/beta fold hydrolase n=1 Tax=Chryseobacterium arthrosphaerae TaxID=651561 RepID=UPI003D3414FC